MSRQRPGRRRAPPAPPPVAPEPGCPAAHVPVLVDAVVAAEPLTYQIDLSQKDYEAALTRGYEMKVPLAIRPETRTLRVIVRDAGSGEVGSVTIPVEKFIPPVATAQGAAVAPRRGAEKIYP